MGIEASPGESQSRTDGPGEEQATRIGRPGEERATRTWELTAEPLRDDDGTVVGITCAALDISEQRALARMQQEFISLVSHELRNPLASVKGYAQLLRRRATYQERAVEAIIRQSDHLDRLIADLLDSPRRSSKEEAFSRQDGPAARRF